jgi:hypothetical protein
MTLPPPQVVTDDDAISFLCKRGGRLYVWLSGAGIEHETTAPRHGIGFHRTPAERFELYVDEAIEPASLWRVVFHRFPKAHVRALLNGGAYSPSGARLPSWEGKGPWDR